MFPSLYFQTIPVKGTQVAALLDYLPSRHDSAYSELIRALVVSEQDPVALSLDEYLTKILISMEGNWHLKPPNYADEYPSDQADCINVSSTTKPTGNFLR